MIYMMIGVPGAGKTTYLDNKVRRLSFDFPSFDIISSDDIREELNGSAASQDNGRLVWSIFKDRLTKSTADMIFLDATFARRKDRTNMLKFIKESIPCEEVAAIYFDVDILTAKERNQNRSRQVPEEVIDSMYSRLQAFPPTLDEGFTFIQKVAT